MRGLWSVAAVVLAAAGTAQAGSSEIQYGPAPAWVGLVPAATGAAAPAGAALQMIYFDNQSRLGPDGDEYYTAYRLKILGPEGLPAGNVSMTWSPDTDDIRVHALKIIRGERVIDVLNTTKFQVIQRENNLEFAMLDGNLTATLQAPGLQVGDEIEFAATIKRREPILGGRSQGVAVLPPGGAPGAFRVRLIWPKASALRWRATPDVGQLKPASVGGDNVLTYELRDPKAAITADGAPDRVNLRRFIEFSSFSDWSEVSALLHPLFEQASALGPQSPVKAEAARIAASTSDPAARAAAALQVVQERIRYVYVGLDGGAYRPASADETWTRRFGDCKAKTALLLALLRELGVPAEAVLVASDGGDGLNERLPKLAAFDHVLVRTILGGRAYWLDGTRLGDRNLDVIPAPGFVWALPLRAAKATLEPVEPQAPLLVRNGVVLEIDASRGFDVPAKVTVEEILRGDEALKYKTGLSQLSKEDTDRFLKSYWRNEYDWVEPETAAWRYDEVQNMTVLTMAGEGQPDWEGDEEDGRSLDVPHAGFSPPAKYRRPKEQDQTAPWTNSFPSYKRWTTIIRLPQAGDGWKWSYRAAAVNEQMGGVSYVRDAALDDDSRILRTTMSRRTYQPEITAEEAAAVNEKLPKFDNKISRVYEYRADDPGDRTNKAVKAVDEADKTTMELIQLGGTLAYARRYDDAMRAFDRALKLEPASRWAQLGKAEVLRQKGDAEGALKLLDALVKIDPHPESFAARGVMLATTGHPEEGLAALETAVAARPEQVEWRLALAQAASSAKRYDRGLSALNAGLERTPEDVSLLQARAAIYAAEERWTDALPDLERAIRLQPEEPVNFRNRGAVLYKLGRLEESLRDLDEAMRMNPLDPANFTAKARTLRALGRSPEAIALYAAAVERQRSASTLNNLCWERALSGLELAEAEKACAEAVKLEPKQAGFWDSYGLVALRAGRLDEALRRYDQALSLNPKLAASLYARGLTRLRKGDAAGGRADLDAALALSPKAGEELNLAGLRP